MSINPTHKPMVIRDPIHGYLEIAPWERAIIDHPIAQRLRRVAQTGLSDMVFPEARTTRFSHSLGSMHLASKMFLSCIENSREDIVKTFVSEIYGHLPKYDLEEINGALSHESTIGAFSNRMILPGNLQKDSHARTAISITAASLRLAALFHDLGHLPLSHDFENALRTYVAEIPTESPTSKGLKWVLAKDAPHEVIGHRLADLVFEDVGSGSGCPTIVREMAFKILEEPSEYYDVFGRKNGAFGWLHSLIDGELDVDRSDYLLRDGRAFGLDFATFDLDRLLYSVSLWNDDEAGFITAISEQGLSPIESYILSRNRSHKTFVRHHKVAQLAVALRISCVKTLKSDLCNLFKSDLNYFGNESVPDPKMLSRFQTYDDGWWWEQLRETERQAISNAQMTEVEMACFDAILRRRKSLKSVWKRRGDLTGVEATTINAFFSPKNERYVDTETQLSHHGIAFSRFHFSPYKKRTVGIHKGHSIIAIIVKGELKPASLLSPVFKAVEDMWEEDVHGFAYSIHDHSPGDIISKIKSLEK